MQMMDMMITMVMLVMMQNADDDADVNAQMMTLTCCG